MALATFEHGRRDRWLRSLAGWVFAWSGVAVMWAFWVCFVVFLASPPWAAAQWPLPTVDQGGAIADPFAAAAVDIGLISLFGLQHSLMARPWVKDWWARSLPAAFERCTFVHMANLALFALIAFWQPIPLELWVLPAGILQTAAWVLFASGWLILFAGAWSFGMRDLLGVEQMRRWRAHAPPAPVPLKTGWLYRWLRHPMYVGVLLGVWATPRMTAGHALLAAGLTIYVLIAMRYEERDLMQRFGARYARWSAATR